MAGEVIEIRYDEMETLRASFVDQGDIVKQELQNVTNCLEALKSGGWISDAATVFYNDMESDLMPGVQRLINAMTETSECISQVKTTFETAEEEGRNVIPTSE